MINVEMTNASEFYCFRMTLARPSGERIEVMLHATALVDLIHQCSKTLCQWQADTTRHLILERTGLTETQAREQGLIT